MTDLIDRQAAMERLMAQNVIMDGSEYHNGFNAGVNRAQEVIRNLPTVQTDVPVINVGDMISREGAIDALDCINGVEEVLRSLPPVRFTTLSDDEIETIRIHLSAIKERLCNQSRYSEAAYYEKLIKKFLSSNPKKGEADGQK